MIIFKNLSNIIQSVVTENNTSEYEKTNIINTIQLTVKKIELLLYSKTLIYLAPQLKIRSIQKSKYTIIIKPNDVRSKENL